jgi:hypothetical protein
MDELFRELLVLSGCVGIDKHDAPAVQDLDDPGFAKSRDARFTSAQALQEREIPKASCRPCSCRNRVPVPATADATS